MFNDDAIDIRDHSPEFRDEFLLQRLERPLHSVCSENWSAPRGMAGLLVWKGCARCIRLICYCDNVLLSEPNLRPFENYLKSNILIDYRELTSDDTSDLSSLPRQMLVIGPKQCRTVQEILEHKWFTTEPNAD